MTVEKLKRLGLNLDYPPFAKVMKEKMRERGVYAKGSPLGLGMHFTAGHDGAEKTIIGGIKNGYTYWCTQRDGTLFCAHRANYWGYSFGSSGWVGSAAKAIKKTLLGSVSDDLLGMEMNAAGKVKQLPNGKYRPWWNEEKYLAKMGKKPNPAQDLEREVVRFTPGVANQEKGWYHIYTDAQILTFIKTAMWLKLRNPTVFDFDYCLGHDEVAGPMSGVFKAWRKNDPGAALPWTMPVFREGLKKFYAEIATREDFTFEMVTMDAFKKYV